MHLKSSEIKVDRFRRDDDMPSGAIRIHHRHSDNLIGNNDTNAPRENLRRGLTELVERLNPSPDKITNPNFYPFDDVILQLAESTQEGKIDAIDFDFKTKRWKYRVVCRQRHADGDYDAGDLELRLLEDLI